MGEVLTCNISKKDIDVVEKIFCTAFCSNNLNSYLKACCTDEIMCKYMHGLYEDKVLCGVHSVVDSQFKIRGKKFNAFYLSYVAVLPQYRGCRYGRRLLFDALKKAKNEHVSIAIMDPFRHSFYKYSGFASALDSYYMEINTELIRKVKIDESKQVVVGTLKADFAKVQTLYEIKRRLFDSCKENDFLPEKQWYNWLMCSDYELAYVNQDDSFGYIIYYNDVSNKIVSVQDFRWSDNKSFRALAKYIMNYKYYARTITFETVPGDFVLDYFLEDYWDFNNSAIFRFEPIRMIRVIDLYKVITEVVDFSCIEYPIVIDVADLFFEENNKNFQLSKEGCEVYEKGGRCDLKIDIENFTYLLTGKYSVFDLEYRESVQYENRSVLEKVDKCFPKGRTWSSTLI